MQEEGLQPVHVVYLYASEDQSLWAQFSKHLEDLRRLHWLTEWSLDQIIAGTVPADELILGIERADLVVLLLSPDFAASDACYQGMLQALRRQEKGEALVVPILLRPVNWQDLPLEDLQLFPTNHQPITNWPYLDQAFFEVAVQLSQLIKQRMRLVVLMHGKTEETFVQQLVRDLQEVGFHPVLANEYRQQTREEDQKRLRPFMRAALAVVLLASPQSRQQRIGHDMLPLIESYKQQVIPFWVAGEYWEEAVSSDWKNVLPLDARGPERYTQALQQLYRRLANFYLSTYNPKAVSQIEVRETRNPYKGLQAFEQQDAANFFGRDVLIDTLLDNVENILLSNSSAIRTSHIITLLGASGSGKSSVMKAGLLPRLRKGVLAGSENWAYLTVGLGSQPFEALSYVFREYIPDRSFTQLRQDLVDDDAHGLNRLIRQVTAQTERKVVLFIDQFEELFTSTISELARTHFIDLLVTAISEPDSPLLLLLTLRADFSDRPLAYPSFAPHLLAHQIPVTPMDLVDLRQVIEKPAQLPDVQLYISPDLVGDLLFEMHGQSDALPLLQFTLQQLFELQEQGQLTRSAYEQLGGLRGALASHAETTYMVLSPVHQSLAQTVFLRLVDANQSAAQYLRRHALLSEFELEDERQTQQMQVSIDAFLQARLLTITRAGEQATLEVSHEALLQHWPRLNEWIRQDQTGRPIQQTLSRDAITWEQRSKPKDRLYQRSQLKEALGFAQHNLLSKNERIFLNASIKAQRQSHLVAFIMLILVLLLIFPAGLWLQTVLEADTVTTLASDGPGSLSQIFASATNNEVISFASNVKGTIYLKESLTIDKNIMLRGPGATLLTISGGRSDNVIRISAHATAVFSGLSFKDSQPGLTTDSRAVSFISNTGTLTLVDCVVADNIAAHSANSTESTTDGFAGSVLNMGTLTIRNSAFLRNTVISNKNGVGGAIFNLNQGYLLLDHSIISGNKISVGGTGAGGGIANEGTLLVRNSTVSDNSIDSQVSSFGGGIVNTGGAMTIANSTISGNTLTSHTNNSIGSGILNNAPNSSFVMTNSTVSGNRVNSGFGGGLVTESPATLIFCTVVDNIASAGGGGIISLNAKTRVNLKNSIVAKNHALTNPDIAGYYYLQGYNLIQSLDRSINLQVDTTSLIGADPQLGPLQNNGGASQTQALQSDSPAIDQIPLKFCLINGITTDQRGIKRPQGSACDIGAYEFQ